jgi:hypothetical protein
LSACDRSHLRSAHTCLYVSTSLNAEPKRGFCNAPNQDLHGFVQKFLPAVVDFPPAGGSLVGGAWKQLAHGGNSLRKARLGWG